MDTNDNDCIIGIDLLSGSPESRLSKPLYSAVAICDDGSIKEWNKITLARLFRLVWEIKPSIIAVDSLQEIASNKKSLAKIGELLPSETNLVWVNIDKQEYPRKLTELAMEEGLVEKAHKPTSMQTAYIVALLAKKGLGKSVFKKNEVTKLVIRKARVEGKGGMSSNRYKRKIRGVIKQLSREIQSTLQKTGIEYEVYYKKSIGGLEKAVFIIYAPPNEVKRLISKEEFQDVLIETKPVVRLLSLEEVEEEQPVIVGIDPGYNFGLAIIDIEGKVLFIDTMREISRAEITDIIRKYGKPIILATDVYPVPETARKLASSLRAKLYTPREKVEIMTKREIANTYIHNQGLVIKDSHSRDALAAAYLAFREIRRKLQETEEYIKKTGLNIPLKKVQLKVVNGKSIADAVEEVINEIIFVDEESVSKERKESEREESLSSLIRSIDKLKLEKEFLLQELQKKNETIKRLEEELNKRMTKELDDIDIDRRIESLYNILSTLSTRIRKIEEELNLEKSMNAFLFDRIREIALKRKIVVPHCSFIIQDSSKIDKQRTDYCFVADLNESLSSLPLDLGLKSVAVLGECNEDARRQILERGVGVLCQINSHGSCEVIESKLLICDQKIIALLDKEAEKALEIKNEIEKMKILKLLTEYKEDSKKREKIHTSTRH